MDTSFINSKSKTCGSRFATIIAFYSLFALDTGSNTDTLFTAYQRVLSALVHHDLVTVVRDLYEFDSVRGHAAVTNRT